VGVTGGPARAEKYRYTTAAESRMVSKRPRSACDRQPGLITAPTGPARITKQSLPKNLARRTSVPQTQEHRDGHRPAHNFDGPACGMCTTIVIFGLIVAAVLTVPALARILGAAVLILLALIALAYAEERRPVPVPSPGGSCPVGWTFSPTSRMCAPSTTMRCRAVRRPAGAARQDGLTRRRRACASRSGAKIAQLDAVMGLAPSKG
jgi:hypothetical protein